MENSPLNYVDPDGLKPLREHLREIFQGIYDSMMGDSDPRDDADSMVRQRVDMLGGIDRDNNFIRDTAGEAGAMLGDLAKDQAMNKMGMVAAPIKYIKLIPKAAAKKIIKYSDEVTDLSLRGQNLTPGSKALRELGLAERVTKSGRHEFYDPKTGIVRAA